MKLRFIKQGVTYLLFTEVSFLIFGDGFQKRTKIQSSPRGAKVVIGLNHYLELSSKFSLSYADLHV